MTKKLFAPIFALLLAFAAEAAAAHAPQSEATVVADAAAKRMLLGRHMLSLQWVSWERFGRAEVTERNGSLWLKGEQASADGTDYLRIDGRITRVDSKTFDFTGTIVTRVSHINGGEPCTRDGDFTFAITQSRKYWRLQQMQNPCDEATDYVDVYFRR
jgi:hypothetical protein